MVERWRARAAEEPDAFWAEAASELPWFRTWDAVFEHQPPTFRWFPGGRTNMAYNAVDHQVKVGNGGRAALAYANERGVRTVLTYSQLLNMVTRLSAALRGMGIGKGDRITVYMPTCPESIALMLATLRIGAIHSVVFAGFGAGALAGRVEASGSRLVFTGDVTFRRGNDVDLKTIVDDAAPLWGDTVEHVIVLRRARVDCAMTAGRDIPWEDFLARGEGRPDGHEEMEANEPAYILATSGTTAKPKLAVHTHGGYQVWIHAQARWIFGLRPQDVWWATSEIGWAVGHSYVVYAPLLVGCTSIVYEGALDFPEPNAFWRIVEEFGVTGVFTSPTAVRLLMRYGTEPTQGFDLSRLERVFCAGEVLNAPAWEWLQREVLHDRIPVMDHMWQTETGGPVFGNPYGVSMLSIKPGSAGIPLAGIDCAVVDADGAECPAGEKGIMVIKKPFPGLTASLWGEPERYGRDYWERLPGVYYTGDSAHVDEDGYVFFAGRADEIIKIAAHRLGTIEVETAFLTHPAVAEAGVTGKPDEVRGETISAFVVLRQGHEPSDDLRTELLGAVRKELGPVAVVSDVNFVSILPKTRSGKIMRRVLKAVVLDTDPGDITTIEDEGSVEEARHAWEEMKAAVAGG